MDDSEDRDGAVALPWRVRNLESAVHDLEKWRDMMLREHATLQQQVLQNTTDLSAIRSIASNIFLVALGSLLTSLGSVLYDVMIRGH